MLIKILEFNTKTVQAIRSQTEQLLQPRQALHCKGICQLQNKYSSLPGCDAVQSGKWYQARPWKWRTTTLRNATGPHTKQHGVTSQKWWVFSNTAVRASDLPAVICLQFALKHAIVTAADAHYVCLERNVPFRQSIPLSCWCNQPLVSVSYATRRWQIYNTLLAAEGKGNCVPVYTMHEKLWHSSTDSYPPH